MYTQRTDVKQVLIETKAFFSDPSKLGRGTLLRNGCHCLLGGIASVCGIPDEDMDVNGLNRTPQVYTFLDASPVVIALAAATGLTVNPRYPSRSVLIHNDNRNRTPEQILKVLDVAIAVEELKLNV